MHIVILSGIVLILLLLHWIAVIKSRLWQDVKDQELEEATCFCRLRQPIDIQEPELGNWPGLHLAKPLPWTPWQQHMLFGKTRLPGQLWKIASEEQS